MTPTALGRSSIEYEGKSRVEKIPEAPGSQKTARLSRRSTKRGISCSRCLNATSIARMFNLRSRFWERRWTAAIVAASMMPGRSPRPPSLPKGLL
jgi:hypothetical protein